jgi:hypothetical protein
MAIYKYLGYGVTNSKGKAKLDHDKNGDPITHSYTGTGAGELDIIASLDNPSTISDSSIQSEIYSLLDAIFVDYGVTGKKNSNWSNYSNRLTVVTDETGTTLTGYESSNGYYFVRADNLFTFTDYTAEFTVVGPTSSNVKWYHQNQDSTNENVFAFNGAWFNQDENNVKITVSEGTATLFVNGTQRGTTTLTVTSPYEIAFRFANGTQNTITYKDFKIY